MAALKMQLSAESDGLRKRFGPSGGDQIRNWYWSMRNKYRRLVTLGQAPDTGVLDDLDQWYAAKILEWKHILKSAIDTAAQEAKSE